MATIPTALSGVYKEIAFRQVDDVCTLPHIFIYLLLLFFYYTVDFVSSFFYNAFHDRFYFTFLFFDVCFVMIVIFIFYFTTDGCLVLERLGLFVSIHIWTYVSFLSFPFLLIHFYYLLLYYFILYYIMLIDLVRYAPLAAKMVDLPIKQIPPVS